jgi:hypothetical protein
MQKANNKAVTAQDYNDKKKGAKPNNDDTFKFPSATEKERQEDLDKVLTHSFWNNLKAVDFVSTTKDAIPSL